MKLKRVSIFTQTVIAGAIVLGSLASVSAGQASQHQASHPSVTMMEQHWQSLIQERDPARRQVLVNEHRHMMDQARKAATAGKTRTNGMDEKVDDSSRRDLMNTIDMHSIMLDMMK